MKLRVILAAMVLMVLTIVIASCQSEADLNFKRYYSTGSTVYQSHCQNCHGANGEGLGMLTPPLTDTAYIKANLHQLPCFIKNGMKDSVTIGGKVYSQAMPPQAQLSPIEIAEVVTYVGNSFGNKVGLVDVDGVNGGCR